MAVQDFGSTAGCSILYVSVPSFSVKIVSELLIELGGYNKADTLATNYRVIPYSPKRKPDVCSLDLAIAESYDLSAQQSQSALHFLRSYAHKEAQKALSNESEHVGFALGLARKESGDLFVREVTMIRLMHKQFGWSYLVGFSKDITDDIAIEQLLSATSDEAYNCLINSRAKTGTRPWSLSSSAGTCSATQCFDKMAEDMWGAVLARGFLECGRPRAEARRRSTPGFDELADDMWEGMLVKA